MQHRKRQAMRGFGRLLRQVALMALSLVVAVAIFRAGTSYVYCAAMNEVRSDECCKSPFADGGSACAVYAPHDCCAVKKLGALPSGAALAAHDVPSAPLLMVHLPPPPPVIAAAEKLAPVRFERRSTGPPRPSGVPPRLQVFLI